MLNNMQLSVNGMTAPRSNGYSTIMSPIKEEHEAPREGDTSFKVETKLGDLSAIEPSGEPTVLQVFEPQFSDTDEKAAIRI